MIELRKELIRRTYNPNSEEIKKAYEEALRHERNRVKREERKAKLEEEKEKLRKSYDPNSFIIKNSDK